MLGITAISGLPQLFQGKDQARGCAPHPQEPKRAAATPGLALGGKTSRKCPRGIPSACWPLVSLLPLTSPGRVPEARPT